MRISIFFIFTNYSLSNSDRQVLRGARQVCLGVDRRAFRSLTCQVWSVSPRENLFFTSVEVVNVNFTACKYCDLIKIRIKIRVALINLFSSIVYFANEA